VPLALLFSVIFCPYFAGLLAGFPLQHMLFGVLSLLPVLLVLQPHRWSLHLETPARPPRPVLSTGDPHWARSWTISRLIHRSRTGIPEGWNPVLVAAVRNGPAAVWSSVPALAIAAAIALPLTLIPTIQGKPAVALALANSGVLLAAALVLPGLAALSTVGDLDRARLDLLRSTPLTSFDVLRGHLEAVLLTGSCFFLFGGAVCLLFLPLCLLQETWMIPVIVFPALATVALVASTAGVLAAVVAGTTQKALVLAYLLALGILIGIPYVVGFGVPFSSAFSPLSGCIHTTWEIADLRKETSARLFFVSIAVSLAITAVQFWIAVAIFGRRWMRDR
jgi:hypothetical protein